MPVTYRFISTVTVSTATAANIEFTNIPATFDDLLILSSTRNDANTGGQAAGEMIRFNGSSATNYSYRVLEAFSGTAVQSYSASSVAQGQVAPIPTDSNTANTFGNSFIYISNYRGTTNKSISSEGVAEYNSATAGVPNLAANLWSVTDAITSIRLFSSGNSNFKQHSSASLYGIKRT